MTFTGTGSWEVPAGGIGALGFTNTGLGYDSDTGHFLIGDFDNERIVKTTLDGTYVSEIILAGAPNASVQGVTYDPTRQWYWVSHYVAPSAGSGTIRAYDAAGVLQHTITTALDVGGPNGNCYEESSDTILACFDDGRFRSYNCSTDALVENVDLAASIGSGSGTGPDGITIDPNDPTIIYVSSDVTAYHVAKVTRATGAVISSWRCPISPESMCFIPGNNESLYLCCDADFHAANVTNGNRVWRLSAATGVALTGLSAQTKHFAFDLNASTSTQIVTGVGQRASLIYLYSSGATPGGAAFILAAGAGDYQLNQWAMSSRSDDNQAAARCDLNFRSTMIAVATNGQAVEQITVQLTRVDHDGFALAVTNGSLVARRMHCFVVGGNHVLPKVGTFDLTPAAGTQSVTTPFEPKAVLFGNNLPNVTEGAAIHNRLMLGAMSASDQWVSSISGVNGSNPTDEQSVQVSNAALCRLNTDLTLTMQAGFSAFGATSFTVTKVTPPGTTIRVGYIALGGEAFYKVGMYVSGTEVATAPVTGVGFTPKGLLLVSDNKIASGTASNESQLSIGAVDGVLDQSVTVASSENAVTPSSTARDLSEVAARMAISQGGTPDVLATGAVVSFDADGWTVDNTVTDGVARAVAYFAIGGGVIEEEEIGDMANVYVVCLHKGLGVIGGAFSTRTAATDFIGTKPNCGYEIQRVSVNAAVGQMVPQGGIGQFSSQSPGLTNTGQ